MNQKCEGKKFCDCANEAFNSGASRDAVDGYEAACKFRQEPVASEEAVTAEEAAIQKHLISHGFNVLAKQNFIDCMKEYSSIQTARQRNEVIQECMDIFVYKMNGMKDFKNVLDELESLKSK